MHRTHVFVRVWGQKGGSCRLTLHLRLYSGGGGLQTTQTLAYRSAAGILGLGFLCRLIHVCACVRSNVVRGVGRELTLRKCMQENRLLPPEAYAQCDMYGNLQRLLEDTFLNYMVRMHASPC